MLDPLELSIFVAAARHLNFAKAAKELRLSPSQVSKAITALEDKLQKKLFQRTTRLVRLTDDGQLLLPAARQALSVLRDAGEVFVNEDEKTPLTGRIRVACAHTLAVRCVAPLAARFHSQHPGVEFEFVLADHYQDLVDEGLDMAVRVMKLHDSSLIARKIGENPVILCASPEYLRTAPAIKSVSDLKKHTLFFIPQHRDLVFKKAGIKLSNVSAAPWVHATNGDFLVELAKNGGGVLARSDWGVAREVKDGSLVPLQLRDHLVSDTAIYAVYQPNRFMPRRLRAWLDFLKLPPFTADAPL